MFDFDAGKIIIVGVVALIFIPPKDLPRVLRQVGQFVGKMRRMAAEFQGQFMDAMREADMADLKREAQKLSDAARVATGLDSLHDMNAHMTNSIDRPMSSPENHVMPEAQTSVLGPDDEPTPAPAQPSSLPHASVSESPKPDLAAPAPIRQTA